MTVTLQIKSGDIVVSEATGRPLEVEGHEKLRQDARHVLANDAKLAEIIGLVGDVFSIRAEMSQRIEQAFALFRLAQESVQRGDRTKEERYSRTLQMLVVPLRSPESNSVSNTSYAWRVDVASEARVQATVTVTGTLAR